MAAWQIFDFEIQDAAGQVTIRDNDSYESEQDFQTNKCQQKR